MKIKNFQPKGSNNISRILDLVVQSNTIKYNAMTKNIKNPQN